MEQKQRKPDVDARKEGESLHDYFMRRKLPCYCRACRAKREDERNAKNQKLV